jgi:hypothetical protein
LTAQVRGPRAPDSATLIMALGEALLIDNAATVA